MTGTATRPFGTSGDAGEGSRGALPVLRLLLEKKETLDFYVQGLFYVCLLCLASTRGTGRRYSHWMQSSAFFRGLAAGCSSG